MTVNIVTALSSEAEPLVAALSLKPSNVAAPFKLYESENVALLVTGIGMVRAAAGVGWLAAHMGDGKQCGWLNVGIAGHSTRARGEVLMAGRIIDAITSKAFYPPPGILPDLPRDTLVTVQAPELDYADNAAYDMEASAIQAIATRFVSAELVQYIKVVSDGPDAGIADIDRGMIMQMIEAHTDCVIQAVAALHTLAREESIRLAPPVGVDAFLARWHFTTSRQHQLVRVLRALAARDPAGQAPDVEQLQARDAKDVIAQLEQLLQRLPSGLSRDATTARLDSQ